MKDKFTTIFIWLFAALVVYSFLDMGWSFKKYGSGFVWREWALNERIDKLYEKVGRIDNSLDYLMAEFSEHRHSGVYGKISKLEKIPIEK